MAITRRAARYTYNYSPSNIDGRKLFQICFPHSNCHNENTVSMARFLILSSSIMIQGFFVNKLTSHENSPLKLAVKRLTPPQFVFLPDD